MTSAFKEMVQTDLTDVFFRTGLDVNGNDRSELAEVCSYTPSTGSSFRIACIPDDTYEEQQPQLGTGVMKVQSHNYRVLAKVSDFPSGFSATTKDVLRIGSQDFLVVTYEDNGQGVAKIKLFKKVT